MFIFLSLQLYNLMNGLLLNLYLGRSSVSKFIISNEIKMFRHFYEQYNLFLVNKNVVAIDCIQNHVFLADISIKPASVSCKP